MLPVLAFAQKKQFKITGNITGYPDGTVVDLINGNNGTPEKSVTLKNGTFELTGNVPHPDIKLLSFNKEPNYIPFYVENTNMVITADASDLTKATVTGSQSHIEFLAYSAAINPYMQMLNQQGVVFDEATKASGVAAMDKFLTQYPESYVAPFAVFRIYQFTEDFALMEKYYTKLPNRVKSTTIGTYIGQQIQESKFNAIGSVIEDFTQEDTAGVAFKLSSLRGKYVLIDFWASWCRPCRDENPNVVNAYNKYKSKNFTVLGVSLDKTRKAWIDAIHKDQLTWTNLSDLKGWGNEVAQQFRITSIPQNILIGPDGKILAKNLRGQDLIEKLNQLLK